MDGVGVMELRGGKVDITGIPLRGLPPIPLDDRILDSTTLEETLSLDMVGG
jgi:hypothetical protein